MRSKKAGTTPTRIGNAATMKRDLGANKTSSVMIRKPSAASMPVRRTTPIKDGGGRASGFDALMRTARASMAKTGKQEMSARRYAARALRWSL
jgi:hypothetical protein